MQCVQSWRSIANVIALSLCISHYQTVMAETYHIVTSPSSPCPGEFIGEPCLTLQQYAASPSQDSNVTLMIEPGTHRLQSMEMLITRRDNFIMTANGTGTQVIFYVPREVFHHYYFGFLLSEYHRLYNIKYVSTTSIRGIHFSCAIGTVCEIEVMNVQELIIEDCTFQGIELDLYQIMNAVILQSCFYDTSKLNIRYSNAKITTCTFSNNTQAVYYYSSSYNSALIISESKFINNTSAYSEGAAVYLSEGRSILINSSLFVNNIAASGGGALYLDGEFNVAVTNSTFINNFANSSSCGAISVLQNSIGVQITDSIFYYNRANMDGGAVCIRSTNVNISKCTFIQNRAVENGGVILLDKSTIRITSTLFKNNRAGQDGGALATLAHPSNYTIIQTSFINNHAEDDGGAVFIGHAESDLRIEQTIFRNNHATDRGGAITIFGSTMIMITTNVYDNTADLGTSMCACNSEVYTSFSDGQRDTTHPECTNYDTSINEHDLPVVQEQGYPDIIHLSSKNWETTCSLSIDSSLYGELRKASATAYTAVTISVTLVLALLLYIIFTKAFQYRTTQRSRAIATSKGVVPAGDQEDPLYDEARDYASSKTDTRDIEMMPNVVYGKHTTS